MLILPTVRENFLHQMLTVLFNLTLVQHQPPLQFQPQLRSPAVFVIPMAVVRLFVLLINLPLQLPMLIQLNVLYPTPFFPPLLLIKTAGAKEI